MDRTEMIRRLAEATLESALNDPDLTWLRAMLHKGFAGFEHMPDERLVRELQLRGLLDFEDPEPGDDFDDDDEIDDDGEDDLAIERSDTLRELGASPAPALRLPPR